jgi:ribosome production factor 2
MIRNVKPKTIQGKRALKRREPKIHENVKTALFLKSLKCSETVNEVMCDMRALKKPYHVAFNGRNDIHPYEDESSINFVMQKNDTSLFVLGSHSKKRPNHLTIGRGYDGHLLDMIEMEVKKHISIAIISCEKTCGVGQKPLFVFVGEMFREDERYKLFKNIILDFYRGEKYDHVSLSGLEHVISCCHDVEGNIYFRCYCILLKKSLEGEGPRVELDHMGPYMDFKIDRVRLTNPESWKEATVVPKSITGKKRKNVSTDEIGDKVGRVYVEKQDFSKLQTRKMKGLKKKSAPN